MNVEQAEIVRDADTGGPVLVLEDYVPWEEVVLAEMEHVLMVVAPSSEGGWRVQVVPKSLDDLKARKLLPEAWAGLRDGEFSAATGIEDGLFCDPDLSTCLAKSRRSAQYLAHLALGAEVKMVVGSEGCQVAVTTAEVVNYNQMYWEFAPAVVALNLRTGQITVRCRSASTAESYFGPGGLKNCAAELGKGWFSGTTELRSPILSRLKPRDALDVANVVVMAAFYRAEAENEGRLD